MRPRICSLTLLLFIVLTSSHLIGQDTASLTGTVTDPANAVVTNARVTVTNLDNGVYRMTGTNSAGEYLVSGLPPAHYDIAIAASGFAKHEVKDLVLGVAQKARLDAKLQIARALFQVTVAGQDVAQIENQSSELGGTITGREIAQLQLNGRDFTPAHHPGSRRE